MNFQDQTTVTIPYSVIHNTIHNYSAYTFPQPTAKSPKRSKRHVRGAYSDLDWLLELNRQINYTIHCATWDAAGRGDPPKCHPDTRIAAQNSLVVWRNDPSAGPVRWISGWAGTGKTTIAQTMAEYWASQGLLAATFFFSRSNEWTNTTEWFAGAIAHQLLKLLLLSQGFTLDVSWDVIVQALRSIIPLSSTMVIIIDGPDECRDVRQQVDILRNILRSADTLKSSIKFFISCRPERRIEKVFDEFDLGSSYRIHLGQSAADKDDIRAFLRLSFDRICKDRRTDHTMSIMDGPWPSNGQIEELVDRASGQFIFAATVIRFVDDETRDPVEALHLIITRRLHSFQPIDALYFVILERVQETLFSRGQQQLVELMGQILLSLDSSLGSAVEIAQFWFKKEVDVYILLRLLRAVLVHDSDYPTQIVSRLPRTSLLSSSLLLCGDETHIQIGSPITTGSYICVLAYGLFIPTPTFSMVGLFVSIS